MLDSLIFKNYFTLELPFPLDTALSLFFLLELSTSSFPYLLITPNSLAFFSRFPLELLLPKLPIALWLLNPTDTFHYILFKLPWMKTLSSLAFYDTICSCFLLSSLSSFGSGMGVSKPPDLSFPLASLYPSSLGDLSHIHVLTYHWYPGEFYISVYSQNLYSGYQISKTSCWMDIISGCPRSISVLKCLELNSLWLPKTHFYPTFLVSLNGTSVHSVV